ncbi:MAG: SpaA isopeptide-forming pilin-related protein [Candidatus Scatovivens sp.]
MIEKNKKILKIITIIFIILINISSNIISYGIEINKSHLVKIGSADKHLKYYREASGLSTYIQCSIVGYYENDKFYPAYCMNRDLPGAETSEYDVEINEILKNNQVWRIVKNGYPYKTHQEMGLSSEFDAYCVTKMAIYCVLGQANINYFSSQESDEIGINMLNVLNNLVNIGVNGTETINDKYLTLEKNGELIKENDYYIQNYKIKSQIEALKDYKVQIANNNRISVENIDNENFRVLIPKDMVCNDIEIMLNIEKSVKNFPIFYGKSPIVGTQDYVITSEKYSNIIENFKSIITTNNSKIEITKLDKQSKTAIPNTKFELMNENKNIIQTGLTDENGKIIFDKLYKGKYTIKEAKANENYIINSNETNIDLEYNELKKIQIENEHKKGGLKLIKFDKDNKKITLGGIEFELYDKDEQLVGKYTTDLNGEIKIDNLNIGKYYLKEIQAKNGYEISENVEFEIKYNEITEIEIGNEKTKGKVKVIKVDKDNNEIKIEGVKFIILDENRNIVDNLVTDINGEAISKELPIYQEKYYLKEIETKDEYILNDGEIQINLNSNVIDTKLITNEIKKGKIKILKLDYDTFKPLKGVKFYVISLNNGKIIEQIETNEYGEALTSNLPINCEYKIIEKESLEGYKINKDEVIVKPKWNEETLVTLTNEKEKGRIKIIKVDKDDNQIKLSGVKFELYNNENLLEILETDENGEAYSKWLYSYNEKYYVIEIQGKNGYKIEKDRIEFDLIANKTIDLIIENEKEEIKEPKEEIVEIKKLPKTGY